MKQAYLTASTATGQAARRPERSPPVAFLQMGPFLAQPAVQESGRSTLPGLIASIGPLHAGSDPEGSGVTRVVAAA
jgi:hypothetical protein